MHWNRYLAKTNLGGAPSIQGAFAGYKRGTNTEVLLRSILFIDGTRSTPHLDYRALASQSEAAGKPLRAVVSSFDGTLLGEFEVLSVDVLPDVPAMRVHHIELGMV